LGYETCGIEPARWQAGRIVNHRVWISFFEDTPTRDSRYEVIVGLEFIEHVVNLERFMTKLNSIAKAGTVCYFSTGSISSIKAMIRKSRWRYYEALHVQYFSPEGLRLLFKKWGWRIINMGSGYRLIDLVRCRRELSISEFIKKGLARLHFRGYTRSGIHILARKEP